MNSLLKNSALSFAFISMLAAASSCSKDSLAPAPDISEATFTSSSLSLTYNGEAMPGKTVHVVCDDNHQNAHFTLYSSLDLSQIQGLGLSGSLTCPGVLPGSVSLDLDTDLQPGDGCYTFSGSGQTDYVSYNYSGKLEEKNLTFQLTDCRLKNTTLAGKVFAPAPITKVGIADYTSLPFHLVWELDPAAGVDIPLSKILKAMVVVPIIPVYEGTAYTSVAQAFESLVKTIALTESGNMPVMYVSTLGGAAHIATSNGNMLQYVPSENGLLLYINPLSLYAEYMLASSNNKDDAQFDFAAMLGKSDSRADADSDASSSASTDATDPGIDPALTKGLITALLTTLQPQIAGGIPLTLEITPTGADIYFDTATSVTFLATLLKQMLAEPAISQALLAELSKLDLPGIDPTQLQQILPLLPKYLEQTTRLEIGLSLVPYTPS